MTRDVAAAAASGRKRRHPSPSSSEYFDAKEEVFEGRTLILKLGREEFLRDIVAKGEDLSQKFHDDPVEFFPSLDGKPSLPRWLQMVHPSYYEDAFLYGTPPSSLLSSVPKSPHVVRLCIIAIHKEIYASVSKFIELLVLPAPAINYRVEFILLNYRLVNFLHESVLGSILSSSSSSSSSLRRLLASYWESDVSLIHVESSSTAGVTVVFGSAFPLHERLKSYAVKAEALRQQKRCQLLDDDDDNDDQDDGANEDESKPPTEIFFSDFEASSPIFHPKYEIDWCQFRINENTAYLQGHSSVSKGSSPSSFHHHPRPLPLGVSPPHRFNEFVLFVILPAMALIVVVLLLASFMFCHRSDFLKSKDLRSNSATTTQLRRYSSIRHASETLRLLSLSTPREDAGNIVSGGTRGVNTEATVASSGSEAFPLPSLPPKVRSPLPTVVNPAQSSIGVAGVSRSRSFADRSTALSGSPWLARDHASLGRRGRGGVVPSAASPPSFDNPLYLQSVGPSGRRLRTISDAVSEGPLQSEDQLRAGRDLSFRSFRGEGRRARGNHVTNYGRSGSFR